MKRLRFERPTDYYDNRLFPIDDEICALLKKRREVSNHNPGFPPADSLAEWSAKYGLYEDLLNSLFGLLRNEEIFKTRVEPRNFIKHIPVLKAVEKDGHLYTITFIRQFDNASVVQLNCDWHETEEEHEERHLHHERPAYLELDMGEKYECWMDTGRGSGGQYSRNFIVSPRIPEDYSELKLTFKEYHDPFKDKPTGLEIVFILGKGAGK
ncbi:hypothetical protein [Neobacillus dielmonensis]|uniref:hypothetical protein n=1 Tax=Neobacillus dielmonensis TaxID=1347369 RepID=UPI0005A71250|nr:hypothetical protein [Neobacillus dielmonensis]